MNVDFSDCGADDLEGGGTVIPGYYKCEVAEVKDNPFSPGNIDVEMRVVAGPFKGARIFDTIVDPQNAADTDKAKKCKQRLAMWLTRSGMFTKDDLAHHQVSIDWMELIGKVVVVKAVEDNYTKAGPDGQATSRSRVKPAFDGIFAIDDERIPEAERKKLGLGAARKPGDGDAAGTQAKGQPKTPAPPATSRKKVDASKL